MLDINYYSKQSIFKYLKIDLEVAFITKHSFFEHLFSIEPYFCSSHDCGACMCGMVFYFSE